MSLYLARRGFFDVAWKGNQVTGIPFVKMTVVPNNSRSPAFKPERDIIHVQWRVPPRGEPYELDEVRLSAVDFAPMLAVWVEHERTRRINGE